MFRKTVAFRDVIIALTDFKLPFEFSAGALFLVETFSQLASHFFTHYILFFQYTWMSHLYNSLYLRCINLLCIFLLLLFGEWLKKRLSRVKTKFQRLLQVLFVVFTQHSHKLRWQIIRPWKTLNHSAFYNARTYIYSLCSLK